MSKFSVPAALPQEGGAGSFVLAGCTHAFRGMRPTEQKVALGTEPQQTDDITTHSPETLSSKAGKHFYFHFFCGSNQLGE